MGVTKGDARSLDFCSDVFGESELTISHMRVVSSLWLC